MSAPKPAAEVQFYSIVPQFAVPDVVSAAEYYRDVFGFQILGYFLDPPICAIVRRDAVTIHFGQLDGGAEPAPNILRREDSIDAYIWVSDLDLAHADLQVRGAKIVQPPTHQVYQSYEMVVADPGASAWPSACPPLPNRAARTHKRHRRNKLANASVC